VKTFAKILLVVVALAFFGIVTVMVSVSRMHKKSRREITQIVSEIQPGMSFTSITSRLGQVSQTFTNPTEIQIWGTTKDQSILTNSTLHMFVHDAIPMRWVCIYTDRDAQTVVYASWRDM